MNITSMKIGCFGVAALSITLSCAGGPQEKHTSDGLSIPATTEKTDEPAVEQEPVVTPLPEMVVVAPPLERIRIEGTTRVFESPNRSSAVLGVVVRGARVGKRLGNGGAVEHGPCKAGWKAIAPRGWVCVKTTTTEEPLTTTALPHLDRRRAVPGTSGTIRDGRKVFADRKAVLKDDGTDGGGRRVRMAATTRIGDVVYWTTADGDLVAARDVRRSRGSSFEGVFVDKESELRLPIAFAHKAKARTLEVPIYDRPAGRRIGKLQPREAVNIREKNYNGRWFQLASDGWISGRDARIAELAKPPETVGKDELWLDFSRDSQVIVVYRGEKPIYATLSSSGKYGHRTPLGVYRVEKKVAKTTMNSRADAEEPYEVKNVPWTLFYHHGYAVHGAYWHNKFGTPVSHGCMNLAPTDAKLVYEMLGPEVPAGWSVVTATYDHPGAIVRVKTKANPTPKLRGSAETYAARKNAAKPTALAAR